MEQSLWVVRGLLAFQYDLYERCWLSSTDAWLLMLAPRYPQPLNSPFKKLGSIILVIDFLQPCLRRQYYLLLPPLCISYLCLLRALVWALTYWLALSLWCPTLTITRGKYHEFSTYLGASTYRVSYLLDIELRKIQKTFL